MPSIIMARISTGYLNSNALKTTFWNYKVYIFFSYLLKSEVNSYKGNMRFKQSGVLDSIELKIVNLNQQYEWKQIGQWINKRIEIEDIVWPGLQQKPPLGVPTKFHLKVATLEEHPFIIYKNTIDGTCTGSSVLVRIAKEETQYVLKLLILSLLGILLLILLLYEEILTQRTMSIINVLPGSMWTWSMS